MSFLLDENVPLSLQRFLVEERNFKATTIQDLKKRSVSNGEVAKSALKLQSIIITFDKDFTILKKDLLSKSRVIYIKIHPRDPIVAKKLLDKYLDRCVSKLESPGIIELTKKGIKHSVSVM